MKNIWTIIKKELTRFFLDKRLVFTTLLFPGLMIYAMYSLMGSAMSNLGQVEDTYTSIAYVVHLPTSVSTLVDQADIAIDFIAIDDADVAEKKNELSNKTADLVLVFPSDFDVAVSNAVNDGGEAPSVDIYYNSTREESAQAYGLMVGVLDAYETSISNAFHINHQLDVVYDLASEQDVLGMVFSMLLPFLILSFLFSGCLAVTPESIAGEKERGTIATLLITPIKRHELAIGKILSLSILASLAAISSFIGTILSIPKMMGMSGELSGGAIAHFAPTDYVAMLLVIISIVLFIVSFLAILSAYAKTVKEANTLAMPFMILTLLIGIMTMFGESNTANTFIYLIPIYGPTQALVGVFGFHANWLHILLGTISSMVYAGILGVVLIRMFNSEKIMFNR